MDFICLNIGHLKAEHPVKKSTVEKGVHWTLPINKVRKKEAVQISERN